MNKINELIKKMCPNGIEYRKIGEITNYEQPSRYIVKSTDYNDDFSIPVLTAGQTFILGYTNETEGIYHATKNNPVIIFDDFTGAFKWVDFSFKVKSSAMKMITTKEDVLIRYLYHLMEFVNYSSDEHKRLWISTYSELKVPVPPLEVQREIVRVLDSFTLLIAELIAELTARKKQYDFYRDKMLNFGDKAKIYKICELCESIADGDHMPPPKSSEGIPFITISNIDQYHNIDFENTMHAPESYYNSLAEKRKARKGDILYTVVGSYGMPVCIEDDKKFIFQRHIAILRPNKDIIKTRYMFHAMQSTDFKIQADKSAKGAAQKTIALSALGEMKMSVPSIDVQEKIIKVLDNFEAICTDLNIGLPAEIEARQKQYEYYRDLLLTFAEKGDMLLTDGRTDGRTDRSDQS